MAGSDKEFHKYMEELKLLDKKAKETKKEKREIMMLISFMVLLLLFMGSLLIKLCYKNKNGAPIAIINQEMQGPGNVQSLEEL